jgi:hypothetical protein
MLLVLSESPHWIKTLNESYLKFFRAKVQKILKTWAIVVNENSIKLQTMVLEEKNSLTTNSHLGQWHMLH